MLTSKQIKKLANDIVNTYNNAIYSVDHINLILSMFDKQLDSFYIKKLYNLTDISNLRSSNDTLYNYFWVINDKLKIRPMTYDPYEIHYIDVSGYKSLFMSAVHPEAQEKINSKYLQYITRLEDALGIPFLEILNMELK